MWTKLYDRRSYCCDKMEKVLTFCFIQQTFEDNGGKKMLSL